MPWTCPGMPEHHLARPKTKQKDGFFVYFWLNFSWKSVTITQVPKYNQSTTRIWNSSLRRWKCWFFFGYLHFCSKDKKYLYFFFWCLIRYIFLQISKFLKDSTAFVYGTQGFFNQVILPLNDLILKRPCIPETKTVESFIHVETLPKNIKKLHLR